MKEKEPDWINQKTAAEDKQIYPLIIVRDRYSGAYSGATWIAWNCYLYQLPKHQEDNDLLCHAFWSDYDGQPPCGKGNTIAEAIADLANKVEENENR